MLYCVYLWLQIAAVKSDGSPLDPYNENRTINLIIEEKNENEDNLNRRNDVTLISRDTSIAEYWLYPKTNTKKITVMVCANNPFSVSCI